MMQEPPTPEIDPRTLGVGLNDCEKALARSCRLVCHETTWQRCYAAGIRNRAVNGRDLFDSLCVAEIAPLPDSRFEFFEDMPQGRPRVAIIVGVRDESGEIIDVAAISLDTGRSLLWRGAASMLGAEQLSDPRFEAALQVHTDAIAWLRADRRGLVILDAARARWALIDVPLAVPNSDFGWRLRDALSLPTPRIFIPAPVRAAA